MDAASIVFNAKIAIALIFYLSMPMLLMATAVGLIIALFQAATQLQEQVLGFVAKLTAMLITMAIMADWISSEMMKFMQSIFDQVLLL
ncbi:flagellar biosynthetic protein FliQ [uncultured Roseibium sp.]|uniref:flagellar biosynthetic protein FliQ n=1 Tax=uncultured Roseibium sp. TaxID=1936171 RepID=UPI0026354AED|nr:flagellar biosynthetic protein FliQ [uncultured Roseibium sp.]